MAQYNVGLLNSTDAKDLGSGKDSLIDAFRKGFGTDLDLTKQKSANGKYGGKYKDLDTLAEELVAEGVQLIVASGGIVSARAAAKAAATKKLPVVVCIGQDDGSLSGSNIAGVNLNTPGQNEQRAKLLKDRNKVQDNQICLIVNGNSAMGSEEAKAWAANGRPFVAMGGDNGETSIDDALTEAVGKGAKAIVISADPYFTQQRKHIYKLVKQHGLPACFPFKEYIEDAKDSMYVSYGPDLPAAYQKLGDFAKKMLAGSGGNLGIVKVDPIQYP